MIRLYKFLTEEFALRAIQEKRIKISRLEDLNDPFEFLGMELSDPIVRKAFLDARMVLSDTSGLLCLSKAWSSPLLWSHYADCHRGICLGFDAPENFFKRVQYRRKRLTLDELKIDTADYLTSQHMQKIFLTKFSAWRYEKEYRAYVSVKEFNNDSGLAFFNFSHELILREVIVGQRCQMKRATLEKILEDCAKGVTVRKARSAFRTFSVVNQRSRGIW